MKITVTGSLGHISKPLTENLVRAGHQVKVISSSDDKTAAIEALGATAAIGSIDDLDFLVKAFTDADAVYTMVPPNFGASNYREYIKGIGNNYAKAIRQTRVKTVANLSSVGAHLNGGTGPIAGLHDVEEILNALPDISVKHFRAGFFYVNFFNNVDMIKHMNMLGSNFGAATSMVLVHPVDIADTIAKELSEGFTGKSVLYISSDKRTAGEVASVLGAAIGKPDLKWTEFTDQQSLEGMEKSGMSKSIAETYNEMGVAVRTGILWDDYKKVSPPVSGRVKLEDFAVEFAGRY